MWKKSISSPLHGGKLYFASSRWHNNSYWQLQSRGHATMEWRIVLQRISSCDWKCCFVATIGILFAFPAIIVYWWCSKGASTWSLLPYIGNQNLVAFLISYARIGGPKKTMGPRNLGEACLIPCRNKPSHVLSRRTLAVWVKWYEHTYGDPPFKVTQGHWNRHETIGCLWFPISGP